MNKEEVIKKVEELKREIEELNHFIEKEELFQTMDVEHNIELVKVYTNIDTTQQFFDLFKDSTALREDYLITVYISDKGTTIVNFLDHNQNALRKV